MFGLFRSFTAVKNLSDLNIKREKRQSQRGRMVVSSSNVMYEIEKQHEYKDQTYTKRREKMRALNAQHDQKFTDKISVNK